MFYLLFDLFQLLNVLHLHIIWVVCQKVDGVGNHILRQQRQQLVCSNTQFMLQTSQRTTRFPA